MKAVLEKYREIPLMSGILVGINVVVYAICAFTGTQLYVMGRLSVLETLWNGEYGRILWSMFLHSDINHIFNNMVLLFFLGGMIEKEVGHTSFAVCYILSGIIGNLLSLVHKMFSNDWAASVGASGAVFGLDGVLLALVLFRSKKMPTVTPARVGFMILLSLYSGFSSGNVDNAAHIGGLLTGFVLGTIWCAVKNRKERG